MTFVLSICRLPLIVVHVTDLSTRVVERKSKSASTIHLQYRGFVTF